MFLTDELVFLELQKTGGSHICRLLEKFVNGHSMGKHNRPDLLQLSGKYVVGSIRSPWDWYVSLWAFGVSGRGAISTRTQNGIDLDYYYKILPKAMGKNWLTPREFMISLIFDMAKPNNKWRAAYADAGEPLLFQMWLKLILDKNRRFDVGEGYGFSPLSSHTGLLGYRYLRLFTPGDGVYKDRSLASKEGMADFDKRMNMVSGMIRMEALEDDFLRVLNEAGIVLAKPKVDEIIGEKEVKTNMSKRKGTAYYYDDETVALVAEKENYLIEKYVYIAPTL